MNDLSPAAPEPVLLLVDAVKLVDEDLVPVRIRLAALMNLAHRLNDDTVDLLLPQIEDLDSRVDRLCARLVEVPHES